MAARNVCRLGTCMYSVLSKSIVNRGSGYMQRCLVSSSSYTSAAFGTSRRFAAILAACCGVSLSAVMSYRTVFSTGVKARPIKDSQIGSESVTKKGISELTVTLYQYQNCPFCGKVRAFLDYHGIKYNKVEVSPLWKGEISFSKYKKVPIVVADNKQINDSSVIISALRSLMLGRDSLEQILNYYPEMTIQGSDGKEKTEYANQYFIMYRESLDKPSMEKGKEERKWRKWVDNTFVHTLSPNIYRTASEAMQAFEYFTKESNFGSVEKYTTYLAGPVVMYFVGKHVKNKYNIKNNVREAMYEEAEKWMKAVGKRKFMGGSAPNLADLAVYGVLSGLEGLDAFRDLMTHTSMKPWYDRVKQAVQTHAGANNF